ncbi:response regulator [Pseudoalteromonas sp. SD03]|uniref:Response regulator n=1 Tax=Pseudoalteromonas sp. SD03 TaxID=3231719 RepID=A0AB39ATZ5_9GAMM|nr:response regulator [Pseudoalteromonas undina]
MKILIADDSVQKVEDVKNFLLGDFGLSEIDISVTTSFKDTIREITRTDYDLVILDMSMPSSSGSLSRTSRALAGKDVLATVSYRQLKTVKFILFSQFSEFGRHDDVISLSEIYDSLSEEYSEYLIDFIKYNGSSDLWKVKLESIIRSFKND